ncbi:aldo/keto reductase [Planotetraspora sp. A-T 1434]|uniref:aldo/keto reductase n=1 Tax=Planotetraspora sp. A-T 1434 TaxID=2979219 RepID=UPI0021BEBD2F|nr:aldo/keto reductase [Planotetraspora sp. A-T 1434]MCT9930353.1 aldo/keto reductase [Planotetraspora sp. A-T 1434]
MTEPVKEPLKLSEVGLGGGPLGNYLRPISDAQAEAVVQTAWEEGIRYFDTAPFYGVGLAEQRMGRVLRGVPRDDYVLSTKVGRLVRPGPGAPPIFAVSNDRHVEWDFSRDGVLRSVSESLDRLGVDRIDILFIHDPDHHWRQAIDSAFPALAALRDQGVVRAIGVGMNQSRMLVDFVKHADPDVLLAANQATLLRRSAFDELLPLCWERGITVVAGALFHRGELAAPGPGASEEVRRIAALCDRYGVPIAAAAMRFPLRHPAVRSILLGAHEPAQVRANLEAFRHPIPEELWAELDALDVEAAAT